MRCKFCGKKIKKNSEICICCGRNINEELGTDDLIDAMPELRDDFDIISKMQAKDKKKKEKKEKRAKHKTRRIVIAITLVVLILACVAVGMLLFKDMNQTKQPEEQELTTSAIEAPFQKRFAGANFTDIKIVDAESAKEVINSAKSTFNIKDVDSEFELKSETKVGNTTIYRFGQMYKGIPVYGGEMVIMADEQGTAYALNGAYVTTDGLTTTYKLDKGSASAAITESVNSMGDDYAVTSGVSITEIEKVVCNVQNKTYLAYMANVSGYNTNGVYISYHVFVDGISGNGIGAVVTSSFENGADITQDLVEESYIYEMITANDKFNWNDETIPNAEEPISITEVEAGNASAYVSGIKTAVDNAYKFFNSSFGWKGLSGNGESFKVYINSNEYVEKTLPTEKAMYTNGKLMFFREDMTLGEVDYNTVVHEYAHGVMANIVGFSGTMACDENAAIAEGLADTFAELAEARLTGVAPDWIHGERNLAIPGEGYHISTSTAATINNMQNCYEYSTIVSHMAAYMSEYVSDISVQEEFWFKAMCMMTRYTDFEEFSSILEAVTQEMHSNGRIDEMQYGSIMTGIEMLGASEQDLYSIE
ncbi:MAG: hypothetical protein J6R66_01965 [Clostridia bacterium]|nr:hypothetical protein [Clostridia bacterium]